MSWPRASEVVGMLGGRTFRVELTARGDGELVWRGTVRSVRRVVWCREDRDLGVLLSALVSWLESITHRGDCRCPGCASRVAGLHGDKR